MKNAVAVTKKKIVEENIFRMDEALRSLFVLTYELVNIGASEITKQKLEELRFWLNKDHDNLTEYSCNSPELK